jgi:hypothetical protein
LMIFQRFNLTFFRRNSLAAVKGHWRNLTIQRTWSVSIQDSDAGFRSSVSRST